MRSIILGINDEHDAGCALVVDGKLAAAYEEERFSRKKMHNGRSDGLPRQSLRAILADYSVDPKEVVAITYNFPKGAYLMKQVYRGLWHDRCCNWWLSGFMQKNFHGVGDYVYPLFYVWRKRYDLDHLLRTFGLDPRKVYRYDHHVAHASSAYYTSGKEKALVLTLDGHGSGVAGSISIGDGGSLLRKHTISKYNSVGLLYSTVTAGLGFRAGRHEGKVLGLAAFGNPSRFYERLQRMIKCDGLDIQLPLMRVYPSPVYPHFLSLKRVFKEMFEPWYEGRREDLAAALQRRVEEVVSEWADNAVRKFGISDLAVAGGVFANVKINQRLAELSRVTSLHVFPAMNDGGLAAGSALKCYHNSNEVHTTVASLTHVYLGKEFSDEEIEEALKRFEISYRRPRGMENEIARLLHAGKVVARFHGRGEYGPRALGNRSVLYNGRDKEVNTWLNRKLDRTEFMPFAPSVRAEDSHLYFEKVTDQFPQPADFMTVTVDCLPKMKSDCPAAVHVDNTARPQFVRKESNPTYYKILTEYKKLSGSGAIVNTSFNVHEEPIVNSPKDAVRAFLITRLDALSIGPFLVRKEDL